MIARKSFMLNGAEFLAVLTLDQHIGVRQSGRAFDGVAHGSSYGLLPRSLGYRFRADPSANLRGLSKGGGWAQTCGLWPSAFAGACHTDWREGPFRSQ